MAMDLRSAGPASRGVWVILRLGFLPEVERIEKGHE
jgi:hypothetical protein